MKIKKDQKACLQVQLSTFRAGKKISCAIKLPT